MKVSASFVADSVSGQIIQGDSNKIINGVSIDSRTIHEGEVFFAIIGEKFDGHDFIYDAVQKGASVVILERGLVLNGDITVIKVNDTTKALQNLAAAYRLLLKDLKVVAITGSAGKTTTKDMTASLLKMRYNTRKTSGNLNNFYGLPLTLLDFEKEELAVLEMGMSKTGEISLLADIAKPEIGVITNVGETHLASLGSVLNVARGKMELIEALPEDGTAILNYDNEFVRDMSKAFRGREIIYFGLEPTADVYADNIKISGEGAEYIVHYQGESAEIQIDRPGIHNIYNSLAATAVALRLGLGWSEIKNGFQEIGYSSLRWDVKHIDGITIINDAYNANPMSMKAALDTVLEIEKKRLILVMGAMLELGEIEKPAHIELGEYIQEKGADQLFTVGELASLIAKGARQKGMKEIQINICKNNKEVISMLKNSLKNGDVLLVKGSRSMKMEEITEELSGGL